MKQKKKFITPKMRVIKLDMQELLAGSPEARNKGVGTVRNLTVPEVNGNLGYTDEENK